MWYDDLGIISIGGQSGGPRDGGLRRIKVPLSRLLDRHCRSSYCPAVAHYALALRVDGKFLKFGEEGVQRIRRSKRDRCIAADIVIPEAVWSEKTRNELRNYLAMQVRAAMLSCVARLRKDKESVDEERLFGEIDAAIAEFIQMDFDRNA
jgi:hypothetical protein